MWIMDDNQNAPPLTEKHKAHLDWVLHKLKASGQMVEWSCCYPDLGTGLYHYGCECGYEAMLSICKHRVGKCPACGSCA